jgi:eukaryotic-like serine/threonine-protein kinase
VSATLGSVLPNRIGRYEVLGQLATGGMAEILLARLEGPSDFRRAVVIKRILRKYAQTSAFVAMFLDEARIVAKIRHPNVVQVHELGDHEGDVFLVLEYVAGENLSSVLKRATSSREKLEPALVAHVIAEACAGLHAAHELVSEDGKAQNLVHRDVSPQNIFIAYDGHVKLLDFGVALTDERIARTEVGDVKGKFEYMSPEQANGEPLDRRSDIFAMGVVLYELGTGRRLFKRTSHTKTLDAICKEPVIPPSRLVDGFPIPLEAVCMRALSKKPEDRYATSAEMRRDLLEIARELSSPVEALAERMKRLFPDRIKEKEELLRRVSDGDAVAELPPGEVDDDVRVPPVPDAPYAAAGPALQPAAMPGPRTASPWFGATLTAGTALTIIGVALAVRLSRTPPATETVLDTASTSDSAATSAAAPSAPLTSASTSLSASSEVLVHVESRPAGVHVLTDGSERGTTPLDLRIARGESPIMFELRSPGFVTSSQSIVPDADQKLFLALQPSGRATAPRPRGAAAPSKPGPSAAASGFRRFD